MAVRKNIRSMSASEISAFVQAVKDLKANGKYNNYIIMHQDAMDTPTPPSVPAMTRNAAHRGPSFLPWHREFLRLFELDLQTVSGNPNMYIPFWDWTQDAANPSAAPLWTPNFLGGNGNPGDDNKVQTGAFAAANGWVTVDGNGNQLGDGALRRQFGVNAGSVPTAQHVTDCLAIPTYDVAPWDTSSAAADSFRNVLEGWVGPGRIHNIVHVWIGGDMLPGTSPNDPAFFLHHCMVDKIWADWQAKAGNGGAAAYQPQAGGPAGHNLNDAMHPWTTTPNDVIDISALGYSYEGGGSGGGSGGSGGPGGDNDGCLSILLAAFLPG